MQLSRTALAAGFVLLLAAALFTRPDRRSSVVAPAEAGHECLLAAERGGWCEVCGAGSLATLRIESRILFDALDAHGHEIDPASIECAGCREALSNDGFCETCRRGFVGGQAYLSRLSYQLTVSGVVDAGQLECRTCREHGAMPGWCSACERGIVGNVEIREREEFELVARAFEAVRAANDYAATCDLCAGAMVLGGMCPTHRIDYARGPAAPVPPP